MPRERDWKSLAQLEIMDQEHVIGLGLLTHYTITKFEVLSKY